MFTRCKKHQILYRGECSLCKSGVDAKLNGERLQDWQGNVIVEPEIAPQAVNEG